DVDPTPEVRETRGQVVEFVRLGQVETKQVQHADDDVELAGHAQVQQEQPQAVAHKVAGVGDVVQADAPVLVDNAIQQQVDAAAEDPAHADLVNLVPLFVVVVARERVVVDNREQR